MELMTNNLNTYIYIQSEAEFNRARSRSFWETISSLVTGRSAHLLCFDDVAKTLGPGPSIRQGVQDIPLDKIVGSMGRKRDFTRRFAPLLGDQQSKERWRTIYTLVASGKGFPPIELYKVDQDYFVEDGHHRLSVARHLGWKTIQANVYELILAQPNDVMAGQLNLCGTKCPC